MGSTIVSDQCITVFLGSPASYGEFTTNVEHIETHISHVFLTDKRVYKLKKPVRFDFLDFSTLAARERACRDEVRLNRRLSPHVYDDVVPITRSPLGEFGIGGSGEVVDWVVKMRRLPSDRALDRLITRDELTDADRMRLTVALTTFYEQVPPLTLTTQQYLHRLGEHVRENQRVLLDLRHGVSAQLVRSMHAAQLRTLALSETMIRRRVLDGRILDGHGDLRPEHVYLTWPLAIIDCIEFNREFRQIDVVDELSFLAMECEQLGNAGIGEEVLDAYRRHSADAAPETLVWFYKSYRACVRAKVLLLRRDQLDHPHDVELDKAIERYLNLGQKYSRRLGPPHLVAVGGLMGSGKSTIATALAQKLGCEVLHSDAVRRELFGRGGSEKDYGQPPYDMQSRRQVYREMHRHAQRLLSGGASVILDATYTRNEDRRAVLDLAARHDAVPLLVQCECPDDLAIERMQRRLEDGQSDSDGRPALLSAQREELQPPEMDMPVLPLDTSRPVGELEKEVIERMRKLNRLDQSEAI